MPILNTPAIMLRRIEHGDFDLVITFFTREMGKVAVIAKAAKKSVKRFAGILEPFSAMDIVISGGDRGGLAILREASLTHPFGGIRTDIEKIAFASYWAELINLWVEEKVKQTALYHLFFNALAALEQERYQPEALSILFQVRFLDIAGFAPNFSACSRCRLPLDKMPAGRVRFDLAKGGVVCESCAAGVRGAVSLARGTIKQLVWLMHGDLAKAVRMRFAPEALAEGRLLLETFVPFHLGRAPKSLKFLKCIRREGSAGNCVQN